MDYGHTKHCFKVGRAFRPVPPPPPPQSTTVLPHAKEAKVVQHTSTCRWPPNRPRCHNASGRRKRGGTNHLPPQSTKELQRVMIAGIRQCEPMI